MHVLPELARLISGQSARQSFAGIWMLQDYPNHFVEKKCAVPLDISGVSSDIYIYTWMVPQRPTFSLDLAVLRVFFTHFCISSIEAFCYHPPFPLKSGVVFLKSGLVYLKSGKSILVDPRSKISWGSWPRNVGSVDPRTKISQEEFMGILDLGSWIRACWIQDFSRRVSGHLQAWAVCRLEDACSD